MLRKELLDFIKKYNKEFAIKGYSKLSKPDLQSKVEDVLKRKIPRSMIFKEYQGLKNKPAPKKVAPKKAPAKKAAPKKAAPKKAPAKKPAPAKKADVVSLDFLKELSQKKGYSFDPQQAFKSLKVGDKMFLNYPDGNKAVEIVSSDEKGITFNEYDYKRKSTELHSGPNTIERPNRYTQTILGDKKKKKLKVTWSQFYRAGRKSKNTPDGTAELTTYPYSEYWERRRKNPPPSFKKSILD